MILFLLLGDYFFVVVDYYSCYMEVEVLRFIIVDKVIVSLRKIFFIYGLFVSIIIDNGL